MADLDLIEIVSERIDRITTIRTERGDTVTLDSLGYYAYSQGDLHTWVGVCEPFPTVKVNATGGAAALTAIKKAILHVAVTQANSRA